MIKCPTCGSRERGDEFTDGTGYECPRCFSNVFTDEGSTSLFVACLLAGLVPAVLVFLLVAPMLSAMSGLVQS